MEILVLSACELGHTAVEPSKQFRPISHPL